MKFTTRTEKDGTVVLQLGLSHAVSFQPEPDIDQLVKGVDMLMETVFTVSPSVLVAAVLKEYEKNGKFKSSVNEWENEGGTTEPERAECEF